MLSFFFLIVSLFYKLCLFGHRSYFLSCSWMSSVVVHKEFLCLPLVKFNRGRYVSGVLFAALLESKFSVFVWFRAFMTFNFFLYQFWEIIFCKTPVYLAPIGKDVDTKSF